MRTSRTRNDEHQNRYYCITQLTISVLLSISFNTAQAQPINTIQLWKLCNDSITQATVQRDGDGEPYFSDTFKSGACFGYIRSVIETSAILLSAMEQLVEQDPGAGDTALKHGVVQLNNTYCLPDHSNITDQVLNYLTYIDGNPEELPKPALYSFRRAMEASYPCQASSNIPPSNEAPLHGNPSNGSPSKRATSDEPRENHSPSKGSPSNIAYSNQTS